MEEPNQKIMATEKQLKLLINLGFGAINCQDLTITEASKEIKKLLKRKKKKYIPHLFKGGRSRIKRR